MSRITREVVERTAAQMREAMARAGRPAPTQEQMERRVERAQRRQDQKQKE